MLLKSLNIKGLFNRFDYNIQLDKEENVTILYGLNGIGKTTILNFLFSFSNFQFLKIFDIPFKVISFEFGPYQEGLKLNVTFMKNNELKIIFNIKFNNFDYTRSFSDIEEIEGICNIIAAKYDSMFGEKPDITLKIDMKNPKEEELISIIIGFILKFNCHYIESLRNNLYDFSILEEFYQEKRTLYEKIKQDFPKLKKKIKELYKFTPKFEIRILYDLMNFFFDKKLKIISEKLRTLKNKDYEKNLFESTIKRFFDFKNLSLSQDDGIIITLDDKNKSVIPVSSLSSGEKNLIVIFYDIIFEAEEESFVLIDEPEISLNINWHYEFIDTIREIGKNKDLYYLIATHSPQIVNNYIDNCVDANYKEKIE